MIGVGPHPEPWPTDARYDPELLATGDTRNVIDRYRYWTVEAIVADLDTRRQPFHVAVENWQHDFNIGTVVRNANAFNATGVHIIGKKRWNKRGAMVTDRYVHVQHHPDIDSFVAWAETASLPLIGIDIVEGALPLESYSLPESCVLVFGQEGPGISADLQERCSVILKITQHGSTRSVNVGVASGVAMYHWAVQHA